MFDGKKFDFMPLFRILAVFLAVALVAAAVFAYLYFTK